MSRLKDAAARKGAVTRDSSFTRRTFLSSSHILVQAEQGGQCEVRRETGVLESASGDGIGHIHVKYLGLNAISFDLTFCISCSFHLFCLTIHFARHHANLSVLSQQSPYRNAR